MTAISVNYFRCEPCREIVIVSAVASKFLSPKLVPAANIVTDDVAPRSFIDR